MAITPEMARAELARRELERRKQQTEQTEAPLMGTQKPKDEGQWRNLRNIVTGLGNLAISTANAPSDLARGMEKNILGAILPKKFQLPEKYQDEIPTLTKEYIPRMPEYDIAQMLGQKGRGSMGDIVTQKAFEYLPDIALGGRQLIKGLTKLPLTQKWASRPLREAEMLATERSVKPMQVSEDVMSQIPEYLEMKDPSIQRLMEDAKRGKYKDVFDLQSVLGAEQRALGKSLSRAESRTAPVVGDLRQKVVRQLKNHLINEGHSDIAQLLDKGQLKYAQYKKLQEKVYPILKKAGIPLGLMGILGFGISKGTKMVNEILD